MRAHTLLTITKADESLREVVGWATTPSVDSMGDIVEPRGAEMTLPLPALWQHQVAAPVGWVTDAKVSDAGILATIRLAKVQEPGALKDRLDEVWQSVRTGLVRGLSIGFQPVPGSTETLPSGGKRFKRWRWKELSLVTIQANTGSTITAVKEADAAHIARKGCIYLSPPRRPGCVYLDER